jgi:DNA-binding MarR family transcriptional regulator
MGKEGQALDIQVAAVRAFNRFYTQRMGVLGDRVLDGPLSLSELRVLYELAHREAPTAAELGRDLGLDQGYLSRILARFVERGLVEKSASAQDVRQKLLSLTQAGRCLFEPLEKAARYRRSIAIGWSAPCA